MNDDTNTGNTVYLLVGQRGAGKTHYGARLIESQPELIPINRDEILVRLFRTVHPESYSGEHHLALYIMKRLIRRKLSTRKGVKIILDTWTESSWERKSMIKQLREFGANRIIALYFITPVELVNIWFWQKPGIGRMNEMMEREGQGLVFYPENAPMHDHAIFHEQASGIGADGFDAVIRIDPCAPLITLD